MYPIVPPEAPTDAIPVESPKQLTFVCEAIVVDNALGSVIETEAVVVHAKLLSVTNTV